MDGSSGTNQTINNTVMISSPSQVSDSLNDVGNISNPINVYHVKESEQTIGWIILCLFLTLVIIGLIILITFSIINNSNIPPCNCFGPFGIEIDVDANVINQCGTNGITPCSFNINSLSDAVTQCNNLQSICQAFTFNPTTSTMKIVTPANTFISPQTTLYVRQAGSIST